jgi:hypothetical protein
MLEKPLAWVSVGVPEFPVKEDTPKTISLELCKVPVIVDICDALALEPVVPPTASNIETPLTAAAWIP